MLAPVMHIGREAAGGGRDKTRHSQLLEIAVSNVMTTPVRDSIKLNAVRELHLVSLFKPPPFLISLSLSSFFSRELVCSSGDDFVVVKLV